MVGAAHLPSDLQASPYITGIIHTSYHTAYACRWVLSLPCVLTCPHLYAAVHAADRRSDNLTRSIAALEERVEALNDAKVGG